MKSPFDHNRLLKEIANEKLLPHGLLQEGKSRSFLSDNGWWTVIVEFQSSSFSKGIYLNIGVDFNFYPMEDFSFTYGYREKGFESAKNETHLKYPEVASRLVQTHVTIIFIHITVFKVIMFRATPFCLKSLRHLRHANR